MTIPGLIILNMLVGASIAYGARIQIKNLQRPIFYNRYFTALLLFEVMLMLPVGVYFSAFYPDWSWMYLLDTRNASAGIGVMALLSYPISATAGYLVGYYSARSNADWVSIIFLAFLGIIFIGLFLVGWEKFSNLGTFEQYHSRVNLHPWTSTSLLPSMIFTWLGIPGCWGYIIFRFWREGSLTHISSRS